MKSRILVCSAQVMEAFTVTARRRGPGKFPVVDMALTPYIQKRRRVEIWIQRALGRPVKTTRARYARQTTFPDI